MADIDLAVQKLTPDGVAPVYTALNATDVYFAVRLDGSLVLHFKNTGASPANITFDITKTVGGEAYIDPVVVIPATTGDVFVGDLLPVHETTARKIKFANSLATGVSVAVLEA